MKQAHAIREVSRFFFYCDLFFAFFSLGFIIMIKVAGNNIHRLKSDLCATEAASTSTSTVIIIIRERGISKLQSPNAEWYRFASLMDLPEVCFCSLLEFYALHRSQWMLSACTLRMSFVCKSAHEICISLLLFYGAVLYFLFRYCFFSSNRMGLTSTRLGNPYLLSNRIVCIATRDQTATQHVSKNLVLIIFFSYIF